MVIDDIKTLEEMSLSVISWPPHAPLHRLDSMSVLTTVTFQAIDLPASLGISVPPSGRLSSSVTARWNVRLIRAECQTRTLTCHLSEGQDKREALTTATIRRLHVDCY